MLVRLRPLPQKLNIMEKVVRFFKQDGKWYADIPNHTLEDNEMVMGADVALEFLAEGKDELHVTVTDEDPGWNAPLEFKMKEHDDEGAYYTASGLLYMDFMDNFPPVPAWEKPMIWICNVTHDVFGEHPEKIYVLKIE